MGYRPPKGVRPPQFEGKRTGRPKGSRNFDSGWQDVIWGYNHRRMDRAAPPTSGSHVWWCFAHQFPDELKWFLKNNGRLWEKGLRR